MRDYALFHIIGLYLVSGAQAGLQTKMEIPPAVQMTAGGMLFYPSGSKKHRHVKRQMPDAVLLHHIFGVENVGLSLIHI